LIFARSELKGEKDYSGLEDPLAFFGETGSRKGTFFQKQF
jgi:hypothetical protein